MIHARKDYDRIQDPAGLIPDDEPVFLIRGRDAVGPVTLIAWAEFARLHGADDTIVNSALKHAVRMRDWQAMHGRQVPDMPADAAR